MPGFQVMSQNYLLTFPQCDTEPDVMWEKLQHEWGDDISFAIICCELHQDGSPHRHVYLSFKASKRFRRSNFADFICGKHGNYKSVKRSHADRRRSAEYVKKAGNYKLYGIDEAGLEEYLKSPKSNSTRAVSEAILKGVNLNDLILAYPEHMYRNLRNAKLFSAHVQVLRTSIKTREWITAQRVQCQCIDCKDNPLTDQDKADVDWFIDWLNTMVRHVREKTMPFRPKQVWLVGQPGIGKSTLINKIEECLRIYRVPKTEDFYDFYSNGEYDFSVIDEFFGHKPINWLNEWLDGSRMTLRVKGAQTVKTDILPCMIISNADPHECYKKAVDQYQDALAPLCGPEQGRCKVLKFTKTQMHSIEIVSRQVRRGADTPIEELEEEESEASITLGMDEEISEEESEEEESFGDFLDDMSMHGGIDDMSL